MYCPRCEHKQCDICEETGFWGLQVTRCKTCGNITDEAADICPNPKCQHIQLDHPEYHEKNPCPVCNYPHSFDENISLKDYAEEIGDRMLSNDMTYGQGLAAFKIAIQKLKSKQVL